MTTVVDASVVLKWIVQEPDSGAALKYLAASDLEAPSIWLAETANALWRYVTLGQLRRDEAESRLAALRIAPITTIPLEQDVEGALALANALGHPVYDCLYLALAIRKSGKVVTADKRLLALTGKRADLPNRIVALA